MMVAPASLLEAGALTTSLSTFNWETESFVHLTARQKSRQASRSSATLIRNLRFHKHPDHTRLVVDLKTRAAYTTRRTKKPAQVILDFPHTVLTKKARAKVGQKAFPGSVKITEFKDGKLTITLNMALLKAYKLLTLEKPHRIVLDLYPASTHSQHVKGKTPNLHQPAALPSKSKPAPVKPGEGLLIVLDPGHGGKDPGALGRRGTREKDIVLKISRQLKAMIKKELGGAKVLMTREKDVFIELEDRAEFANKKNADLFVSIHVNSHPKRHVKGLELYHFGEASDPRSLEVAARENGTPLEKNGPAWQFILADKLNDKKIEESQELAWTTKKSLVGHLKKHYKVKDHGVKTAPFFVLRMTTMPSILAEIAFVSNPTEEKLLKSKTYQRRVAEGILEGIKAYVVPLQTASR